jgi:DNA-binding transcriptional MerR regulator
MWRLQKFLSSPRFQLSASGQIGKGEGSRRLFSREDIYRIGIAAHLAKDGFSPKFVSEILQTIEDSDLSDYDEKSERVYWGIAIERQEDKPKIRLLRSGKAPNITVDGPVYYAIDFAQIIDQIDLRIASREESKKG